MSVTLVFECDRCTLSEDVDVYEPSRVLSAYVPKGWGASRRTLESPYIWQCPKCIAIRDAEPPPANAIYAT